MMFTFWKRKKTGAIRRLGPVEMAEASAYAAGHKDGYIEGFTAGELQGYNEGIKQAKDAAMRALKQTGANHHDPVSKL